LYYVSYGLSPDFSESIDDNDNDDDNEMNNRPTVKHFNLIRQGAALVTRRPYFVAYLARELSKIVVLRCLAVLRLAVLRIHPGQLCLAIFLWLDNNDSVITTSMKENGVTMRFITGTAGFTGIQSVIKKLAVNSITRRTRLGKFLG